MSGEWFARTSDMFFARTAAAHRSSKSLTALSFVWDILPNPPFLLASLLFGETTTLSPRGAKVLLATGPLGFPA